MEFTMATLEKPKDDLYYVVEESSFCLRLCCPGHHPFNMVMNQGAMRGAEKMATFHRPLRCFMHPCKCCCYQKMEILDGSNDEIGDVVVRLSQIFPFAYMR